MAIYPSGPARQQDGRNLNEGLVVFGKLESSVLERFAEIVELWEINVAGAARGPVLTRKCGDGITNVGEQSLPD